MNTFDETMSWTRAYLQWIDGETEEASGETRIASKELRRLDVVREAMLLMASRTETDCLRVAEALRDAERLLDDERGAWRALGALRDCDRRRSRSTTPAMPSDRWEGALEAVAAEMHALESKVLALRSGARAGL